MAAVRIREFFGEIPKRQRTLLPAGFAELAQGVRFEDGSLKPFRDPLITSSAPQAAKTIFKDGANWLTWNSRVHVARGSVAQERLYYTGAGAPRMRVNGNVYPLALHPPLYKLNVTALNRQEQPPLKDPDAEIDVSELVPPEFGDIEPVETANRFVVMTQAPTLQTPLHFSRKGNIYTIDTPGIFEVRHANGNVDGDNFTRFAITIVSANAQFVRPGIFGNMQPAWGPSIESEHRPGELATLKRPFASRTVTVTASHGIVTISKAVFGTVRKTKDGPITLRLSPIDNDNIEALDYTFGEAPPDNPEFFVAGQPHSIAVIREPEGGISGHTLVTQPAVGIFDINGDLCHELDGFSVSVRVSSDTGGAITGARSAISEGGIVRFRDLKVFQPTADAPVILEFSAEDTEPASSAEVQLEADMNALARDVLFTFTLVTEFDEESAPAPASEPLLWYPGLDVELSGFSFWQTGRTINRVRVYRSETSALGVTDFYLVKELPWAEVANDPFIYRDEDHPMAEVMPSVEYDPIPDDYQGLVSLPNGMMAAFSGREIGFCEPFIPHAWPEKYRLKVDHEIMGLVSFGSSMAVLTKNTPYVAQGFSPESFRLEKIDQSIPCVSKESIVDLGNAAAYATNNGIALIGESVGAQIITSGLFTIDQWKDMQPSSMVAARYQNLYMFTYRHIDGAAKDGSYFVDLSGSTPHVSRLDYLSDVLFVEPETGHLFYKDGTSIVQFDARGQPPTPYRWKSACYMLPALVNFGAIIARTDATPSAHERSIALHVYADDQKIMTIEDADVPRRLPGGFLSDKWQIEIEGTMDVVEITMAGSIEDLMRTGS